MKILFTGGHTTPAFAVIDELSNSNKHNEIVYVGKKHTLDTERTLSFEYKECKSKKIRFRELKTGRLTRIISLKSIQSIFLVLYGFLQALLIMIEEKPDVIVSFGGYIAVPIAFWGWILRKRILTHEQTMKPGLANRLIALIAETVYVSFETASHYFPKKKTQWIGNPVRRSLFTVKKLPFSLKEQIPVLYVTGGTLGSHSINVHLFSILKKLLAKAYIIHQTGNVAEYQDYENAQKIRNTLAHQLKKRYYPLQFIEGDMIGSIYKYSSLVIGRAGANTFFELIALKKPAILIPLPWSAHGEQKEHATYFVRNGLGELFSQNDTSENLYTLILKMISTLPVYQSNFTLLPLELKQHAAETIAKNILS